MSGASAGPVRLTDTEEVLLRQVHPDELDEVRGLLSTAFNPTSAHDFMLSTLREAVGPDEAFKRHVERDLKSAGTWGVSVAESEVASLVCVDDAHLPDTPADHASIDFNVVTGRKQRQRAARLLRDAAHDRGCLHAPPSEDDAE